METLAKARALAPGDTELAAHLAAQQAKHGKLAEALAIYEELLAAAEGAVAGAAGQASTVERAGWQAKMCGHRPASPRGGDSEVVWTAGVSCC